VSVRRSSLPVLGADRAAAVPLEPPAVARLHAKFPALDGVRALAALSVVAFHVEQLGYGQFGPAERVVGHLNSGVVLFFLLSGFLLYRPFVVARAEGRHVATRAYLVRRLMRIVPAYWLALIALSIWPGLPGFYGGSWLGEFFFLKIYSAHSGGTGLAIAWSLCTEVTFYLALPLYAFVLARATRRLGSERGFWLEIGVLAALSIGSVLLHTIFAGGSHNGGSVYTLPATAYLFCGGMLLALCSVHTKPILSELLRDVAQHRALCWLFGVALLVLVSFGVQTTVGPTNPLYEPMAFLLLLPLTLAPRDSARLDRVLTTRFIATLGVVSYGIYLWHYPLTPQIARATAGAGELGAGVVLLLFTASAAAILAFISFTVLERPALAFAHRYSLSRRDRPASDGPEEAESTPVVTETTPP
jgi:peptidoglycan/LPS O-acetylase OafA/YrhL